VYQGFILFLEAMCIMVAYVFQLQWSGVGFIQHGNGGAVPFPWDVLVFLVLWGLYLTYRWIHDPSGCISDVFHEIDMKIITFLSSTNMKSLKYNYGVYKTKCSEWLSHKLVSQMVTILIVFCVGYFSLHLIKVL